jgi:hypothetical protein
VLHLGPLEWHHLTSKFHENLLIGSKVDWGGGDRQSDDLISLFPILESRLKITNYNHMK